MEFRGKVWYNQVNEDYPKGGGLVELGEKLRKARLEAGLSQRQLCGGEITRNMLSLIENGSAKPSMKTLQYLAGRLGKSVSYFLEETAVISPNQQIMEQARKHYDSGAFQEAACVLEDYRFPDPVYDREAAVLRACLYLELARQALEEGKQRYALELLEKADVPAAYCREDLQRQRLLLMGRIQGQQVSRLLPSLDEELLIRAGEACREARFARAEALLGAVERQSTPEWNLLRGECYLENQDFANAARCLRQAEGHYARYVIPKLEHCYRELQDYKRAYEYACKQK